MSLLLTLFAFVDASLSLALSAAPWLLLGLLLAGVIKGLMSERLLQRWVGGNHPVAIVRAALIGAPLPLCSCGAIPTALALHRKGAGRGPTTAFMIGTPGIGADSVTLTYALLGPVMMLARAVGAIFTAVITGLLVRFTRQRDVPVEKGTSCGGGCGSSCANTVDERPLLPRLRSGLRYAFDDLLDDIAGWILAGLLLAGLLISLLPPQWMASYGSGLTAMLLMALVGIPLYICATAATPIAAGLLLAGVSPGTVLVFLLAAPITSAATLAVYRREMGIAALLLYLCGIIISSVALGLGLDLLVQWLGVDIVAQAGEVTELLPEWLEGMALMLLLMLGIRPLRQRLLQSTPTGSAAD